MSILSIYSDSIAAGVYNVYIADDRVNDEYHVLNFDRVHIDIDKIVRRDHPSLFEKVFTENTSGFDDKLRDALAKQYGDHHPCALLINKTTGVISYE